jgi:aryl-alcohol dehydrogenase-like predicted oxidoreductase
VEYAELGGLTVSRLALGTMLFGDKTPPAEAERILDAFRAAGGTLVDTADVYGDGRSEEVLAPWLARHRDEVVLATKLRFEVSDPGGAGLAPDRIVMACDASLRRMGVESIDLYQVHAPDSDVPLEDSLEALDGLVRAGKVRELGASNFPAWLLAWAVALQDREGWAPFVSLQPQYSLVERSVERELVPFCRAAGLGILPWGPLGAGFLTGRYRRDEAPPPDSRMGEATDDLEEAPARRATERNFAVADAVVEVARERGVAPAAVALAWLLHQPAVTAPIHGPRTLDHLTDVLGATELELSPDQLARLDTLSAPAAGYPERFLSEQVGFEPPRLRRRSVSPPAA